MAQNLQRHFKRGWGIYPVKTNMSNIKDIYDT